MMRLDIDGAGFDVIDEGSGTAIVLIHGFSLAKETWDQQAAVITRTARVVRYDLRGLGASSVTPGPYLMERHAGDLAEILDALGIERAVIAGHSLGGYVAFAFVRMFAERVLGLGLVGTRATADDEATARGRLELAERVERVGIAPVCESYLPRLFAPAIYRQRPNLIERARSIIERTDPRGAAATLRGMAVRVSSEDLFEEIAVPVRIVAGADDAIAPVDRSREMAAGIRQAELEVLACGHFPQYEAPDALTASLARLLAAADPGRQRLPLRVEPSAPQPRKRAHEVKEEEAAHDQCGDDRRHE